MPPFDGAAPWRPIRCFPAEAKEAPMRTLALFAFAALAFSSLAGVIEVLWELDLTRFGGHPMVGAERSVHDAEESSAVSAGVPAADR